MPAHTERNYKLQFFTYVEGVSKGIVKFLNESTNEYLYYNVTFTSLPPEDISEINLQGPVRQLVSESIVIENPLDMTVTLSGSSDSDQIIFPETVTIEAGLRGIIELSYRPLLVGDHAATVSFACEDLGLYRYKVNLIGTTPPLDNSISFSVPLGARQVLPFRFMHYLNAKAEYSCKFQSDSDFDIEVSKIVAFAAGQDGVEQEVEVSFEPARLGESFRNTLIVSSPSAGEYRCIVMGRCVQPQPQGPLEIKGSSGSVNFKNVFSHETTFKLSVDNPAFKVNEKEVIQSKHSKSIAISYKSGEGTSKNCRLAISCNDIPFPWIYYITATDK